MNFKVYSYLTRNSTCIKNGLKVIYLNEIIGGKNRIKIIRSYTAEIG